MSTDLIPRERLMETWTRHADGKVFIAADDLLRWLRNDAFLGSVIAATLEEALAKPRVAETGAPATPPSNPVGREQP